MKKIEESYEENKNFCNNSIVSNNPYDGSSISPVQHKLSIIPDNI